MKIAKKLLVVVLALAMVSAFAAIAFAANPSVSFSVGEYDAAKGRAKVTANFVDGVGITSGNLKFAYEKDTVSKITVAPGADAKVTADLGNAYSSEFNADINPADYGFYFKENLWATSEWTAVAEDLEVEASVNGENFNFATFTFTAPEGTVITVTGELKVGDAATPVNTTFTIGKAAAPVETTTAKTTPAETTTAKTTPAETTTAKTTPAETTTAKTTPAETTTVKPASPVIVYKATGDKKDKDGNLIVGYDKDGKAIVKDAKGVLVYSTDTAANEDPAKLTPVETTTAKTAPGKTTPGQKTDNGKKTGDNSVLAVMAGVIALAGAAFVVTKKRK